MSKAIGTVDAGSRLSILTARRNLKMARSAHAYVRGSTVQFYEWLGSDRSRGLPAGPPAWICGDCHVGNMGPLAGADGRVNIQIRDLDQTVIGNPAHDLVRLGLSLAMAARGSDLPGVATAKMLEEMVIGYREALGFTVSRKTIAERESEAVGDVLEKALSRKWKHLAEERIEDIRPTIPRGDRFWDLTENEAKAIEKLVQDDAVRALLTVLKDRNRMPKSNFLILPTGLRAAAHWVAAATRRW